MNLFYAFFIAFCLVFFAELGDKTQLLVLSFSNKSRAFPILLGVALGTFFSHGVAILFGSRLGSFNSDFQVYFSVLSYVSFVLFGIFGFWKIKRDKFYASSDICDVDKKSGLINKISNFKINYVLVIALSIVIGELGDKTFLASLGLGVQYPDFRFALILGSITAMVVSNSFAIFLGRFIGDKFSGDRIEYFSNFLFVLFGVVGLLKFCLFL